VLENWQHQVLIMYQNLQDHVVSYVSEWVRAEGHYASGSASSGARFVSESARSVVLQDWMLIMRQNV